MSRRIVVVPRFHDSAAALDGTPETKRVVDALVHRATNAPESARPLPGLRFRALHSRSYGDYPALRLFYWCDDKAVYLYRIEPYDELEG